MIENWGNGQIFKRGRQLTPRKWNTAATRYDSSQTHPESLSNPKIFNNCPLGWHKTFSSDEPSTRMPYNLGRQVFQEGVKLPQVRSFPPLEACQKKLKEHAPIFEFLDYWSYSREYGQQGISKTGTGWHGADKCREVAVVNHIYNFLAQKLLVLSMHARLLSSSRRDLQILELLNE